MPLGLQTTCQMPSRHKQKKSTTKLTFPNANQPPKQAGQTTPQALAAASHCLPQCSLALPPRAAVPRHDPVAAVPCVGQARKRGDQRREPAVREVVAQALGRGQDTRDDEVVGVPDRGAPLVARDGALQPLGRLGGAGDAGQGVLKYPRHLVVVVMVGGRGWRCCCLRLCVLGCCCCPPADFFCHCGGVGVAWGLGGNLNSLVRVAWVVLVYHGRKRCRASGSGVGITMDNMGVSRAVRVAEF